MMASDRSWIPWISTFAKGEMVSIVGRNGAGKSTLAKVVCGFEKEDHGAVLYEGQNIRSRSIKERAEIIGFVMQNPNQMISKSLIFDEVALGLRLRKIPEEEIKPRVEKVLDICGLSPFISWPISALSYGQKKRVTIASILVLDPCILILDEPTAGQDYRHYSEIMDFLREINQLGITIILITHDMHLMLEYTPRAVVLSGGLKIADTRGFGCADRSSGDRAGQSEGDFPLLPRPEWSACPMKPALCSASSITKVRWQNEGAPVLIQL